jgi:hypothetical protein
LPPPAVTTPSHPLCSRETPVPSPAGKPLARPKPLLRPSVAFKRCKPIRLRRAARSSE